MREIPSPQATEEEIKRVIQAHQAVLRFFFFPTVGQKDKISYERFKKGPILDLSNRNEAGEEAIRDLGVTTLQWFCLSDPNRFSWVEAEELGSLEAPRKELVGKLQRMPTNSQFLITAFDHRDGFITPEAIEQIKRILVQGGHFLATYRDESSALPKHDNEGKVLLPGLSFRLMNPPEFYDPDLTVVIWTKSKPTIDIQR